MYGIADACTDHVAAATGANNSTANPMPVAVRAPTSSEPCRRTFQPACNTAAASARASASSGTRWCPLRRAGEHALGCDEEAVAERAAELVPAADPRGSLRAQPLRIRRRID